MSLVRMVFLKSLRQFMLFTVDKDRLGFFSGVPNSVLLYGLLSQPASIVSKIAPCASLVVVLRSDRDLRRFGCNGILVTLPTMTPYKRVVFIRVECGLSVSVASLQNVLLIKKRLSAVFATVVLVFNPKVLADEDAFVPWLMLLRPVVVVN